MAGTLRRRSSPAPEISDIDGAPHHQVWVFSHPDGTQTFRIYSSDHDVLPRGARIKIEIPEDELAESCDTQHHH